MREKHVRVLIWIWCILLFLFIPAAHTADPNIQIIGSIRYSSGDNPQWSPLHFDDTAWQLTDKQTTWEKISPRSITWYRIHFYFPEKSLTEPALLIGPSSGADEIYLNGVKIGGEGVIGNKFVAAPNTARLCKIPPDTLKQYGENVLALRVMFVYMPGAVLADSIRIGEYSELLLYKFRNDFYQIKIEMMMLALFLIILLQFVLNVIAGALEKNTISFGFYIILACFIYIMDSLLFYESGLKTYILQRIYFSMIALIPVTIPFMLTYLYNEKVTFFLKAMTTAAILLCLCSLFFFNVQLYFLIPYIWCIIILAAGIEGLRIAISNWLRKVYESGIMLAAVLCVLFAGVSFAVTGVSGAYPFRFYRDFMWVLAGPAFMFLRIFTFIHMYARINKSHALLSRKILEAQEAERARLSRELHDSVGQSLLAVQLNLDMMGVQTETDKTVERETLLQLRSEVTKTIEEVRRVATELRPSFLDRLDIVETIIQYGKNFEQISGIKVIVKAVESLDVSQQVKHNLYRICQEALTNIGKHASATMIKINLENKGRALLLEITDNGRGFVASKMDNSSNGLGLSIMQERAELLGGALIVKSAPGSGTSIIAEVPVR